MDIETAATWLFVMEENTKHGGLGWEKVINGIYKQTDVAQRKNE